ncbi:MAG: YqaJ viral recombinase family protein [Comamonas sp.]|jgi:putative phage-type endonuclease|uniref:YqaJ viral recombinase family protein n=1 Tax=Comamonas sp. TaxID=34028 RepID=UPI0028273C97|nr:YqaJ viral recombinase family protein [Comamonas sp.]MDR0212867.1 YqaJ viral recombinase family protein [Comamonas sp.]
MKTIHNLIQGSAAWHQHRATARNASDASPMMACSPYKTRSALVKERATGIAPEIDAATQARFDRGHAIEKAALPLAEKFIGDELSPVIGTTDDGYLSASFDGLTFCGTIAWECKSWNEKKAEVVRDGNVPQADYWQCVQQLVVSGAEKLIYTVTDGTPERTLHAILLQGDVTHDRAALLAGWEQFDKDVAGYDHNAERPAAVVAEPVESLPAVAVQLQGSLAVVSNLDKFGDALRAFIERMVAKPATDQEFADAEAECKALKKAEEMLEAAESGALAQISDVELLRRTVADLRNLARTTRLAREKLVAAEKDARRTALVTGAQQDLDQHVSALNQRLGANWLPRIAGGFAETIKGKKSLQNMQDVVAVALTNAKAEANSLAQRLEANREHLVQEDGDWIALFADFATVGTKAAEDFQALAVLRIGQHKQAEAQRLEAQREQIRKEEAARLEREAAAKAQADAEQERQRIQQQAKQEQAEIAQAQQAGALAAPVAGDLAGLVQDKAAEGVAGIDAQAAIAAAQTSAAAVDAGQTMTLGQLNTRMEGMGLGKISAATLEHHGIPFTKERAAVQITSANARRLMLLLSMGYRKLADELQAVTA